MASRMARLGRSLDRKRASILPVSNGWAEPGPPDRLRRRATAAGGGVGR
jgi:hypothetical protein